MTYFKLRKHDPEPEEEATPDAVEEQLEETVEEDAGHVKPAAARSPLAAGILGPGAWIAARFGTGPAWGIHAVAMWAIGFYRGWIAVGVILVWLLAVLLFIPREALERWAQAIERRFESGFHRPTEAPSGDAVGDVLRLLYSLIGEAHGVHLSTVLAHLQEHGRWEGRKVADLKQHLGALGIPVQPKLKIGGTPTRGVLKADLDALSPIGDPSPSPTPSPPV